MQQLYFIMQNMFFTMRYQHARKYNQTWSLAQAYPLRLLLFLFGNQTSCMTLLSSRHRWAARPPTLTATMPACYFLLNALPIGLRSPSLIHGMAPMSGTPTRRSEEHTSELQSLMRNSY